MAAGLKNKTSILHKAMENGTEVEVTVKIVNYNIKDEEAVRKTLYRKSVTMKNLAKSKRIL